ncbi:MAG TPA: hypothetical protein VF103_14000, partial [Polyangiaceae bacterium]
ARLESAPKARVLEGGSGWFFGNVALSKGGAWSGVLRADAKAARVRVGTRRSLLDAAFSAAVESDRRGLERGSFGDVLLEVTSAEGRREDDSPLRASIRAPRVDWTGFPPNGLRGRASLAAPRIEPVLAALGMPPIVLSLWPDAPLDASARFVFEEDALDVRLDLARSGAFRAMGRLRVCSPPKGAFLVKNGPFSVGLAVRGDGVRVVPLASDKWLAENAPQCPDVE